MSSKIEKTIARQQQRISEGQFYEAHQQLRVIASRYAKASNWAAAVDILSQGAAALLRADQGGSGGDLCLFLLDVYKQAEMRPDAETKGRILGLLRMFPKGEPTRKRVVGEMIGWSSRFGEYPAGDPELHHVAGTLYADEDEPYEAERHLLLGTRDSPERLTKLLFAWYAESGSPSLAASFAARAVLPYLAVGNVRAASKSLLLFGASLSSSPSPPPVQDVSSATAELRVYPSLPLMNFLGLLLQSVQRGDAGLYRMLRSRYDDQLREVPEWEDVLGQIAEMYFGIRKPSQSNPLFDMMSSMLMGGGSSGGSSQGAQRRVGAGGPPAAGLD
ncbi:hypothetical protein BDY21DRAFT_35149 [Lineolata rhizophorae]|uniref:DUF410-domain-containing protein n=1 Tax=Lineolata rhizophorae TaxID=578093 RepID=A0A6A6P058_9PEZI|nr:hypothetical protein BDY21DRAFT_35149 [Lineolata rhizophorae]